jgi:plastocyanin
VKAAMNTALTAAPDDIRPSVQTLVDLTSETLDEGGDTFTLVLENEEFGRANSALDAWMVENCGYDEYDVVGVNYAFSGMPAAVKAGVASIRFTNEGTEVHEMVLFHIADGVTESIDELLALPEEEVAAKAEFLGVAFAMPDAGDTAFYDLEPGRYGYLCFLPEGSTPENLPGLMDGSFEGGPPHFTLGMKGEFTVEG